MNKAGLTDHVAQETGSSKAFAESCVAAVMAGIRQGLEDDKSVQLVGFGTFVVRHRKARSGVNPQTGEAIQIMASKTVGFKPSKTLKDTI